MCGEKRFAGCGGAKSPGSPPRVRGKGAPEKYTECQWRITPACAGKRHTWFVLTTLSEDHPRVCGEKSLQKFRLPAGGGSPPRVRGKVFVLCLSRFYNRITPACAGKRVMSCPPALLRDHPRVCGEKWKIMTVSLGISGSPPRVRGKVAAEFGYSRSTRITPACAGKRQATRKSRYTLEDHPRVCGEKVKYICPVCGKEGSPPRVRGKGCVYKLTVLATRITPACAGKRLV